MQKIGFGKNLGDSGPRPLKFARSTQFFVSFSGSTVSITGQNFIKFGPSVWVSRVFQWKNVHKNGYYGRPMHPIDPKTISLQSYDFSAATVKILTSSDVGEKIRGWGLNPQPPKFFVKIESRYFYDIPCEF